MSDFNHIISKLTTLIQSQGYDHFGFAPLEKPISIKKYEDWIEKGLHGEMSYLKEHLPFKKKPASYYQGLASAILITAPYVPNDDELGTSLRVAQYAKSKDYHIYFKGQLQALTKKFENEFPEEEFLCFTDSAPILERDLAWQAGLGWIGKNTCLIDRKKGSLFFIGEILTTLKLENQTGLVSDFCGTCSRCIDACPTGAIKEDRVLDARHCISYLNIESKSLPPENLRRKIGDWFFGCDICQTVCPWNEKASGKDLMQKLSEENLSNRNRDQIIKDLRDILSLSNKQLMDRFKEFPLTRARGFGLKRNALIVIGNLQLGELKSDVQNASRQWPRLKELCDWTLECLNNL